MCCTCCNFCPWKESPLSSGAVFKSVWSQHSTGFPEHCNPPHLYITIIGLLLFYYFFFFLREGDLWQLNYFWIQLLPMIFNRTSVGSVILLQLDTWVKFPLNNSCSIRAKEDQSLQLCRSGCAIGKGQVHTHVHRNSPLENPHPMTALLRVQILPAPHASFSLYLHFILPNRTDKLQVSVLSVFKIS